MHVIHRTKAEKPQPFIPTVSQWAVPGHRKVPCKRYNDRGEFIGMSKPAPVVNPVEQKMVRDAQKKGARRGLPPKEQPFNMSSYTPLPRSILVTRGPLIKEECGVALPEAQWHYGKHFIVVKVGRDVTACATGDVVLFGKGFRPREAWLGAKYYLGREQAVVGLMVSDGGCEMAHSTA